MTRDEPADGTLHGALRGLGVEPVTCVVLEEHPPPDAAALKAAADSLDQFDWVICSSVRAVNAIAAARSRPWPAGVHTAAVGARTANALVNAGAVPMPIVGAGDGADALWAILSTRRWQGARVLLPGDPGGRPELGRSLREAGAVVEEVEAYRMVPRPDDRIRADWAASRPDAAVIASPKVAARLAGALGVDALNALTAIVAIGPATSAALTAAGVRHDVSPRADLVEAARMIAFKS